MRFYWHWAAPANQFADLAHVLLQHVDKNSNTFGCKDRG
jgi:hypothetical protein